MNLRKFLMLVCVLILSSCGSNKKVIAYKSKTATSKVIVTDEPIKELSSEMPKIKPIVRNSFRITPKNTREYVEKFAPIAMRKMQEHKIPASITLAQGILESGSGRSPLAIRSNNHFGIKCHKGWEGHSITHDDDEIGECFRKYKYPETSYEDHSTFLTSRKRYARLFRLKITDYRSWAYGLKRAGYATDPKYPNKLISLIKKYNLTQYDRMVLIDSKIEPVKTEISSVASPYYQVQKGDTLYSIAKRYNITVRKLKQINGLTNNTIGIGQELLIY